jgi:hypothetical protein
MDGQAAPRLSWTLRSTLALTSLLGLAISYSVAVVVTSPSADAADWKGTREVRDGVAYVWNPAEPMEGTVEYELREIWRLESEKPDGSLVFGTVNKVTEDEAGNVYLLDTQLATVHVVSPRGQYVRSIGRKGEGPGELNHPTEVLITHQGIVGAVDLRAGKALLFNPDGLVSGEVRPQMLGTGQQWLTRLLPAPTGFVACVLSRSAGKDAYVLKKAIQRLGEDGAVTGTVFQDSLIVDTRGRFAFDEEKSDAVYLLDVGRDGRILVSRSFDQYEICVYSADGKLDLVTTCEYVPPARTAEELQEEQAYWQAYYRNADIRISKYDRTIAEADVKRDGSWWVVNSRGWREVPAGAASCVDVFDRAGRYVRKVCLMGSVSPKDDLVFFLEDRVVVVTSGVAADAVAVGAGSKAVAGTDETDTGVPVVICFEVVASE